jgi:hypothetical protein
MQRFAIIESGTVVNIAKAAEPLADNWIEATAGAEIGGTYDPSNGFSPAPGPTSEEIRTQTRLPRTKFAIAAAKAGLITEAEAEEWSAGAAVPQWVSDALEAAVTAGLIPQEERLGVRIAIRTQDTIGRMDRLIPILADSADLTPEQVDALFGI